MSGIAEEVWANWKPTDVDVRSAKSFVLERLTGSAATRHEIERDYVKHFPNETLPSNVAISEVDDGHPAKQRVRATWALRRAIGFLEADGLIFEETTEPLLGGLDVGGRSVQLKAMRSPSPLHYQLAPKASLSATSPVGLTDPDIFLGGVGALKLAVSTQRCAQEALKAYSGQRYLSCAVLLGAVCEGATYSIGEALRARGNIKQHVASRQLQGLNRALADYFTTNKKKTTGIDDGRTKLASLMNHANLMIRIRNFGAHPMSTKADQSMEAMLSEDGCALLIVGTYNWLRDWDEIIRITLPRRSKL